MKHKEVIEEILEFEGYFDLVHVRSHSGKLFKNGWNYPYFEKNG